jgi:hypothetical protein
MAQDDKTPKVKWYKAFGQAFAFVRKNDSFFLPAFIVLFVLISGTGLTLGFLGGSTASHITANVSATLLLILATMILLIRRIDKAVFKQNEGTPGGSSMALKTIRRGWKFEEDPIAVGSKGKTRSLVFVGVGKGGIALIAEGGQAATRPLQAARARLNRIVPGVPILEFHTGHGPGELPLAKLVRAIKKSKRILSRRERTAIEARLRALGAVKLPIPKGIDPMKARPDRKALRGR